MTILDILKKKILSYDTETEKTVTVAPAQKKSAQKIESKHIEKVDTKKTKTVQQKTTTLRNILQNPRVTEKAAILAEKNAYTFEVDPRSTKLEIARAVKLFYKVEPVRVNIIKQQAKKVVFRGKRGTRKAVKKAIVFLKVGDKIDFI
ncbi:50S ribosomal protein L23 [Patescibacteria group bacterium]|nr:50S ribosomal protein L23 [Patescibacteria group bacterium]MBU1519623.1 50S ribosomal protein L23 [Patescibacteria group bacterium]MBU2461011.1 50S ribosomal protein L23 [Patescibacteria group bacterium]